MSRPIEIKNQHDEKVGDVTFDDDPINLNVWRTAAGFTLSLPAKTNLVLDVRGDPMPLMSNLSARVFAQG